MRIAREHRPVFLVTLLALLIFTVLFLIRRNYEFIGYIAVIVFFMLLIIFTAEKLHYPLPVLWGLAIWAILHMAGGGIRIGDTVLYGWIIWPMIGEPYSILKFDQVVHVFGFFVATLVAYYVLKPVLLKDAGWFRIGFIVIMAGLGLGALNEIVEFFATVVLPETGVGGYENTALDLVADLLGAMLGFVYVFVKERK